jgi:hypothetical protein
LLNRAEHLAGRRRQSMGSGGRDFSHEKASLVAAIPETLQRATLKAEQRGEHLYFRVPEGVTFKSELGKEMRGIDLKWNGYVLLPGSRHFSGVTYELAGDSLPLSEIAELPGEMLEAFSKPKTRRANLVTVPTFSNRATPYGAEALRQEVEAIASTDEGSRNNTLFRKGISISELIGGGELPPQAIGIVAEAAKQSGLSDDEIDQVLFREGGAFQIGLSQPRNSGNPVVSIDKERGRIALSMKKESNAD